MPLSPMLITRRDFVRSSVVLGAVGLVAPGSLLYGQQTPIVTSFKDLRRGVGCFTGRGGTIGWFIDKNALVVVDTQMPESAALCLSGLAERSTRDIDLLINSHHHWDHTGGNGVFKPKSKRILAHLNVPGLQKSAAERMNRQEGQVYATETYEKEWTEDVGGESIRLHYWGAAHTSGDSVIHFEKANVVHTGDLVFNRIAPVIDTVGGSSVANWVVVLERMHKEFTDETIFIFGHGGETPGIMGSRKDLLAMRDYLSALLAFVQKGVKEGKTETELTAVESIPGFEDYSKGNLLERFRGGIKQTFAQVTAGTR